MITPAADAWGQPSPLAMQFMTGGQMGYMPQAQFLTPAEYGAFRTLPNPAMSLTPSQSPSLWQNFLIQQRGGPFGLPAYTANTYNPAVNQQLYMYMARRRVEDEALAGAGSVADIMLRVGMGAVGGLPGAALAMVLPDLTTPLADRLRERRTIQDATMSRIVGGPDLNLATGMGFGARAAGDIDAFIRRSSARDTIFKEGDYRKLLSLGVEYGMFDYAQSGRQYREALKKLRNSLTTAMEVVGSTDFKDLMDEFKRLQSMGADQSRFAGILRQENMYGRMAGLRHADMVDTYGKQGALIYAQAGLSNIQGSTQAMSYAAMLSMAQRQGLVTPGYIARKGGLSGAVQDLTAQDAQVKRQFGDYVLTYVANDDFTDIDEERRRELIRRMNEGGMDPRELMRSASRLNTAEKMAEFQARKATLRERFDTSLGSTYAQENFWFRQYQMSGALIAPDLDMQSQIRMGAMLHGFDPEAADLLAKNALSKDRTDQYERERSLEWSKRREEYEQRNNPFRRAWVGVRAWAADVGESMYDTVLGSYQRRNDAAAAREGGYLQPETVLQGIGAPRGGGRTREGGGHAADPGWMSDARPEHSRELVRLTEALESNGAGIDFASRLEGDKGGWSYGPQQMSTPTMRDFLADLRRRDHPLARLFVSDGKALKGDEADFPEAWRKAAATDGAGLDKAYHDYLWKTHWVDLRKKYLDSDENYRNLLDSDEVLQFLYRVGIHSRTGMKRVLDRAFAGKDVAAMSMAGRLEALREATLSEIAAKMDPRFRTSVARGYNELADALLRRAAEAGVPQDDSEPLPVWDDARLSKRGRAALARLDDDPVDVNAYVNAGWGMPLPKRELSGDQADELLGVLMNEQGGQDTQQALDRLSGDYGVRGRSDLLTLAAKHLARPEDFLDDKGLSAVLDEALKSGARPEFQDEAARNDAVRQLLGNEQVRRAVHSLALSGDSNGELRQALQYQVEDAVNRDRLQELRRHERAFEAVEEPLYGGWFREGLLKGHTRSDREAMSKAIAASPYAPAVMALQALLEKRNYGLRHGWSGERLNGADEELERLAARLGLAPKTVEELRKTGSIGVLKRHRLAQGLDLSELEGVGRRRYSDELFSDAPQDAGGLGLDLSMTLARMGLKSRERSLSLALKRYERLGFHAADLSSGDRVEAWRREAAKINDTAMLQILDQAGQGLQRTLTGPELRSFIVEGTPTAFSGTRLRLDGRADALTVNPVAVPPAGREGLAEETLRGLTGTLTSLNDTLREMNRRMLSLRTP